MYHNVGIGRSYAASLLTHHDVTSAQSLNVLQHLFNCCHYYSKVLAFCQCEYDEFVFYRGVFGEILSKWCRQNGVFGAIMGL